MPVKQNKIKYIDTELFLLGYPFVQFGFVLFSRDYSYPIPNSLYNYEKKIFYGKINTHNKN